MNHAAPAGPAPARESRRSVRMLAGLLLVTAVALLTEALSRSLWPIPAPAVLYLLAVVAAIYLWGVVSGIASGLLALGLGLLFFSVPGAVFHYSAEDQQSVITLLVAIPLAILMVGVLKRRDAMRVRDRAHMELLEQHRATVEDLDAVVWERDPDSGRFTSISRHAEKLLGFPVARWLAEPEFWLTALHPSDRERVAERLRLAAKEGTEAVLEYRMVGADRRVVWVRDAIRAARGPSGHRLYGVMVDLTERRRTEEALRESESHHKAVVSAALDAIVVMDSTGRIAGFNPAAERMFGLAREEAVGRDLAELIIPPELREAHRRGMRQYLETGTGWMLDQRIEQTARRADGTTFPVELTMVAVSSEGAPAFTAFIRDLTRRHAAELASRESESKYRLLMEQASDGILITDLEGTCLDINPRGSEILGYTRDELIGMNATEMFAPEDIQRIPLRLEELRAGLPVLVERRVRRKDGSLLPVEISAKKLDDRRLVGIYRDVTERKRAEEELRHAFSLHAATLDSTTDGILAVDLEGHITSLNRRFVEMWRIPDEIAASRDDNRAIDFVLDQLKDPDGFVAKVRELYATPEADSHDVLEFKDGRVFERSSKPQRIGGEFVGRVWSFRDATERRRAEQALRQSEEQLRQAQKMEAIGRLAGGVAHDFNNLLTAILGNSSLLLEEMPAGDPQRASAEEILRAAERAAALTRQLLIFGRKQMLETRVLDLNAVVADMHKMLDRVIGEHIELVVVPGAELGSVRADRGQIEQVLMNLVVNARDAMPEGGKLILETSNTDVDETFAARHPPLEPGVHVMLAVSDTGFGMDEETLAHAFEPFFTTKERGKGTGLGLSTVYGIVRQSEGAIWVYSQPGRGSTFKIYLPRVDATPEETRTELAPATSTCGTETVLLVEDEAVVRALVKSTLSQRGYQVLEAENGAQALEISERHRGPLHMLVTDIVMPGMNGRELAERLTRGRPETQVLFVSGYTDEVITQQGLGVLGVGFLQKPFTLDALARRVREILDAPAERGGTSPARGAPRSHSSP